MGNWLLGKYSGQQGKWEQSLRNLADSTRFIISPGVMRRKCRRGRVSLSGVNCAGVCIVHKRVCSDPGTAGGDLRRLSAILLSPSKHSLLTTGLRLPNPPDRHYTTGDPLPVKEIRPPLWQ